MLSSSFLFFRVRNLPHIFAGSVNVPDASPQAKLYEVDRIVTHENFNQQTFENNIAVLQMKETIQYSDYITNVWLPIHGQALPDTASLCGWPVISKEYKKKVNVSQI